MARRLNDDVDVLGLGNAPVGEELDEHKGAIAKMMAAGQHHRQQLAIFDSDSDDDDYSDDDDHDRNSARLSAAAAAGGGYKPATHAHTTEEAEDKDDASEYTEDFEGSPRLSVSLSPRPDPQQQQRQRQRQQEQAKAKQGFGFGASPSKMHGGKGAVTTTEQTSFHGRNRVVRTTKTVTTTTTQQDHSSPQSVKVVKRQVVGNNRDHHASYVSAAASRRKAAELERLQRENANLQRQVADVEEQLAEARVANSVAEAKQNLQRHATDANLDQRAKQLRMQDKQSKLTSILEQIDDLADENLELQDQLDGDQTTSLKYQIKEAQSRSSELDAKLKELKSERRGLRVVIKHQNEGIDKALTKAQQRRVSKIMREIRELNYQARDIEAALPDARHAFTEVSMHVRKYQEHNLAMATELKKRKAIARGLRAPDHQQPVSPVKAVDHKRRELIQKQHKLRTQLAAYQNHVQRKAASIENKIDKIVEESQGYKESLQGCKAQLQTLDQQKASLLLQMERLQATQTADRQRPYHSSSANGRQSQLSDSGQDDGQQTPHQPPGQRTARSYPDGAVEKGRRARYRSVAEKEKAKEKEKQKKGIVSPISMQPNPPSHPKPQPRQGFGFGVRSHAVKEQSSAKEPDKQKQKQKPRRSVGTDVTGSKLLAPGSFRSPRSKPPEAETPKTAKTAETAETAETAGEEETKAGLGSAKNLLALMSSSDEEDEDEEPEAAAAVGVAPVATRRSSHRLVASPVTAVQPDTADGKGDEAEEEKKSAGDAPFGIFGSNLEVLSRPATQDNKAGVDLSAASAVGVGSENDAWSVLEKKPEHTGPGEGEGEAEGEEEEDGFGYSFDSFDDDDDDDDDDRGGGDGDSWATGKRKTLPSAAPAKVTTPTPR